MAVTLRAFRGKIVVVKKNKTSASTGQVGVDRLPQLVSLELDNIEFYDRNPRTSRNPEYDRIKRSILTHGLEQPLVVARRPGEATYTVTAGGNTRLRILKDLYASSRDPDYAVVNCVEVSWKDEATALLGHLRENNLRGRLTFAEKAAAVVAFADMMTADGDGEALTGDALHTALCERGFPVSKTLLSYMRYAADFLMPAMPVALSDGLGWHSVARLRKLHKSASRFWVGRSIGPAAEFDDIFRELCRRHDAPDWQFDPLRCAVELEIAEAADVPLQSVRVCLHAGQLAEMRSQEPEKEKTETQHRQSAINPSTKRPHAADETGCKSPGDLSVTVEYDPPTVDASEKALASQNYSDGSQFMDLRGRSYGLAHNLGSRMGLGRLVLPLPDCGNGFLVADVPDADLLRSADPSTRAGIGTMWWQLVAFSDIACAPIELLEERLPAASSLLVVMKSRKFELLFESVDVIDAAYLADRFWSALSNDDWQDWLYLAHAHRKLRAKVIETETPLWNRLS